MNFDGGFVDLRVESHGRYSDDSVWPSFTDIMTVVVMIFLLALIVILVRNVELVNQLRTTMEAERAAAEIARATELQKETLAARLIDLEEQLSQSRLQLLQSREQQQETSAKLSERTQQLARTQSQRDALARANQTLSAERDALRADVATLQADVSTLRQTNARLTTARSLLTREKAQLEQRVSNLNRELADVREAFTEQETELVQLREEQESDRRQYLALRGEYSDLKKKYDRLIRPARTSLGKYVVEIRFQKSGSRFLISLREPDQDQYETVTRQQLDERLSGLKSKWGDKLYTKIVIPENSGLSYSEAWTFTNEVLSRFDYYYQN